MKRTAIALAAAGMLLTAFVFTACQPTPEEPAVVNKAEGKLEQTIQSAPAPVKRITEETVWQEQYDIPGLRCGINAQITLPEANTFPVYKVKQREFDAELADRIIKYFTAGATGVRETSDTKEELEQQLVQAKRGTYMEDDNGARWEPYEGQEDDIKKLEEQIANAVPETFNDVPGDTISLPVYSTYRMADEKRLYVNAKPAYISIYSEKFGITQMESWLKDGGAIPGEPPGTTIDVNISEEEASEAVNKVAADLGLNNFGIALTEKARIVSDYTAEIVSKGWEITLTRNDGGSIPVSFDSVQMSGLLDFSTEDFVERWRPETILIYVDEKGVRGFYWNNPLEVTDTMNENVSLMPFDDIKKKIKDYIKFGYANSVESGWVNGECNISVDKIVLANVLVPIKDDLEHQMFSPTWLVYYTFYVDYEGKVIDEWKSVFAVNAIDGSSIDLQMRSHELEERIKENKGT